MEHRYNKGAPSPPPSSRRDGRSSAVASASKSIITVLQYFVSAAALLVPSSYPYYEVVCEGIHSLSQLLPYFSRIALSSSDEDVIQQCSRLESVLRVVTKSIGFVEVFAERLANTAGSEPVYAATIFFIELLKSACRLAILADRRRASMLVMWGSSERVGSNSDMANYREWYRIMSVQARARSGLGAADVPRAPVSPQKELEGVYRGRRSGLLLPKEGDIRSSTFKGRLSQERPLAPDSLAPIASTPEHLLALGEVLYVARPAVHAWVLHHFASSEPAAAARELREEPSAERGLAQRSHSKAHALALGLSLIIELLSLQLTSEALRLAREQAGAPPPSGSRLHGFDRELRRRRAALLFYLIRSPLFDRATLPALKALLAVFLKVPLLSAVPKYALNVLAYLNECHFYNSNSS